MARITFKGDAFGEALRKLEFTAEGGKLLEDAAKAGVQPVADEIRKRLEILPTSKFQRLPDGEQLRTVSQHQKEDLLKGLGVTPVGRSKDGFVNCKVGFDGYGSFPTKAYPNGVPNALIARAAESGSSVRLKSPFIRPAVRYTRKQAISEMDKVVTDGLKKIFDKE